MGVRLRVALMALAVAVLFGVLVIALAVYVPRGCPSGEVRAEDGSCVPASALEPEE